MMFIAGVGTGGRLAVVGNFLRKKIRMLKLLLLNPKIRRLFSGGKPGPHKIQGIGAGFIPES